MLFFRIDAMPLLPCAFLSIVFYLLCNDVFVGLSMGACGLCLFLIVTKAKEKIDWTAWTKGSLSRRYLMLYPVLHLVSLFSSSFIEEEHQSWYYFLCTYLLLVSLEERSWRYGCLLALSRLIRGWNQTGNKWLNEPDVGDFLNT